VDREQMIWRRSSPEERRQQLRDDLRRVNGFLTAVVAEAEHLHLPVPANAPEILESLRTWEQQLTPSSGS
jgi:hypothetical protein